MAPEPLGCAPTAPVATGSNVRPAVPLPVGSWSSAGTDPPGAVDDPGSFAPGSPGPGSTTAGTARAADGTPRPPPATTPASPASTSTTTDATGIRFQRAAA